MLETENLNTYTKSRSKHKYIYGLLRISELYIFIEKTHRCILKSNRQFFKKKLRHRVIVQVSFNKQKKKMVIRFHDLPTIPYQDLDSCSGQPQSKVAQVIFVGQISSSHNFFPRSRSFLFCMNLWSYRKRQQFHFSGFFIKVHIF